MLNAILKILQKITGEKLYRVGSQEMNDLWNRIIDAERRAEKADTEIVYLESLVQIYKNECETNQTYIKVLEKDLIEKEHKNKQLRDAIKALEDAPPSDNKVAQNLRKQIRLLKADLEAAKALKTPMSDSRVMDAWTAWFMRTPDNFYQDLASVPEDVRPVIIKHAKDALQGAWRHYRGAPAAKAASGFTAEKQPPVEPAKPAKAMPKKRPPKKPVTARPKKPKS